MRKNSEGPTSSSAKLMGEAVGKWGKCCQSSRRVHASRRESSVTADAAQVSCGRNGNPLSSVCLSAALWSCAAQTQRGDCENGVMAEAQGTVGAPGEGA